MSEVDICVIADRQKDVEGEVRYPRKTMALISKMNGKRLTGKLGKQQPPRPEFKVRSIF
jgi:hypothetical protein